MADRILDAKGLICPLPILKTRKTLKAMNTGQVLVIEATDPASVIDFAAFCNQTGNELLSQSSNGDVYRFEIRRG
ncbi:sulfurtransferase TusA family protein [Aquicoccus porphyridii]|uniref:Sulfurtransferase TusA family protein n=1 Tax=Aquicoccus porphyridii TaxID=1852029 RepID=A0A5A9ZSW7_9RHOB|nr:sulfurtransferase TusA family protein [Aquicoccus porphyridii]KAA0920221.1 sulfurtransferase TusA family protein [Aquicoccus porphyridii]RAI54980.1 SirA family protein [Rhodobacteraceae bacterium AsT-22]